MSDHTWRCVRAAVIGIAALIAAACGANHAGSAVTARAGAVSFEKVSGSPFGVAITPDDRYAFVDLTSGRVDIFSLARDHPHLIRTISVPGEAVGCSLTHDGRLLLVANGQGATVVDVARAEDGAAHPVLGVLRPPGSPRLRATGAIETSSSVDGRYVFVSLEYGQSGGAIAVYDLGSERDPGFGSTAWVGSVTLGQAVVGSALSPNGRYLYVTSELAAGAGTGETALRKDGSLSVIDVARAEHAPGRAVLATVPAGLQPVRDAVSPNGSTIWVTARAGNELLAFSTRRLLSDPAHARRATVTVGTAPVGLALFDNGRQALVADSNRFNARGAHAALTIVSLTRALAHRSARVATVRAGGFPRQIAIDSRNATALVTNFSSGQLETVPLPGRAVG